MLQPNPITSNLSNSQYFKERRSQSRPNPMLRSSGIISPKRARSKSPQSFRWPNNTANPLNHQSIQNLHVNNLSGNLSANLFQNMSSQSLKKALDEVCIFPPGFAEILKNEDKNIKQFKVQVGKQKDKIDQDIASFKIQLNHTLEDLRLSLHAQLDRIYQSYLEKNTKFRSQVFDINRLRQQLQLELGSTTFAELQAKLKINQSHYKSMIAQRDFEALVGLNLINSDSQMTSNLNKSVLTQKMQAIQNMQIGNRQFKKYYILSYIADIQRDRVNSLHELAKDLTILSQYQNGFYQSQEFLKVLSHLRDTIGKQTRRIYDSNPLYIRNLSSIVALQKQQQNKVLNNPQLSVQNTNKFGVSSLPKTNISITKPSTVPLTINRFQRMHGTHLNGLISSSEQSLKVSTAENINILQRPVSIQIPSTLGINTALCGVFINNQIAVGLKDGTIQVFSCDGHNIATLKEHKTNICSLTVIRTRTQNYLASGSDVGCSKVVIWDPVTWQAKQTYTYHQAAVTGIVDLMDDSSIISAGYDKKINIYNYEANRLQLSVPPCKSPITSAVANKNASKFIACCLDNAIYVWHIVRDFRLKAQNIVLQRKIQNNSKISAIISSQILPQLVVIATQDSKVKLLNIQKGESYKTVIINGQVENSLHSAILTNYPLQMLIIQRQNKPYYPIALVWPLRQHKIYQINTQTTLVSVKNINRAINNGTLEFGFGVSPKCFFVPSDNAQGSYIFAVNQKIETNSVHPGSKSSQNCVSVFAVEQIK